MEADDLLAESWKVFLGFQLRHAQLVGRAREHQDVDAALPQRRSRGPLPAALGRTVRFSGNPGLLQVILRHGDMHAVSKKRRMTASISGDK